MSVLYYIPGVQIASRAELATRGLSHFATGPLEQCGVMRGPDGGTGVVVARTTDGLGYFAGEQSWTQMSSAACWLGWGVTAPPRPADFARQTLVAGHDVTLGDGNIWHAPTAVVIDRQAATPQLACALPWVSVREGGAWVRRCQGRYRSLLELGVTIAGRVVESLTNGGAVTLARDGAEDEALAALQANYDIGADVATALELLTEDAIGQILWALIDGPSWGAEKKTDRAGGRMSPGGVV